MRYADRARKEGRSLARASSQYLPDHIWKSTKDTTAIKKMVSDAFIFGALWARDYASKKAAKGSRPCS